MHVFAKELERRYPESQREGLWELARPHKQIYAVARVWLMY